jgi:uncharacterized protein YecE (DUF72 family)
MRIKPGHIRVGLSGWKYPGWRGVFYPTSLRQKDELSYVASLFNTVEINGTFYSLQRPELFAAWRDATPDDFVFAVKGGRFITHIKRLRGVERALANFLASGLLALGHKLGPILWQLPQSARFEVERLDAFLSLLPRDTEAATRLAAGHDERLAGRVFAKADWRGPLRHALEVRHPSFRNFAFIDLLRRHRVALVVSDAATWPCFADVTADFVYIRLHGSEELYASAYDESALVRWASRIAAWAEGRTPSGLQLIDPATPPPMARDVYVYFDNDAKVHAPVDAQALRKLLHRP